jgi:hypothetical protein
MVHCPPRSSRRWKKAIIIVKDMDKPNVTFNEILPANVLVSLSRSTWAENGRIIWRLREKGKCTNYWITKYIVMDQKVPKLDLSWLDCIKGQGTNTYPHCNIALSFTTPSLSKRPILGGQYRTALPTCTLFNKTYENALFTYLWAT